jgi:hypothetical protein
LTVTADPVEPERVTIKFRFAPSFAEAPAIDKTGCTSIFTIVPVALAVPSLAPDEGDDKVIVIVKSDV